MEQEIIRASKEIDVQHLWSLSRLLCETLDLAAGVDLEAHRDHRLDRQPERGRIGVPREVKDHEYRVAITPSGVRELTLRGHQVYVEQHAGEGSLISDADLKLAGAEILERASDVWATADLLLKVKEPLETEYPLLREGQVLFTYLHLAASKLCTDALLASRTTAVAYETVGSPDGTFPLLAPMSEVAGRLAPQVGAYHMMRALGGRGILPGGVPGTRLA